MKENLEDYQSPLFLYYMALFYIGNRLVYTLNDYQLIKWQIVLKSLKNSLKSSVYLAKQTTL